ncbi:hypothetical protein BJ165DRAFT_262402 [Panaeolus papilionaceus]|nr:hypothetical protein BJ165DRAFT_262402 [Panaeolus papilionaceus]
MLGELPPYEIYENLYRQQHLMHAVPAHGGLPDQKAPVKMSRRSSLSASIYSIFSSVRNPGSTASQHTVSTTTDGHGLHPGIFADDASDSWGRSSVTGGMDDDHAQPDIRCDTPESPILFSPPSPGLVPLHQVNESTTTPNLINGPSDRPLPTLSIDTLSLDLADSPPTECPSSPPSSPTTPVSTLHRSKSHSHALRRSTVRASRSASLSLGVDGLNATASFIVTDHGDDRQPVGSRASTPFSTMIDGHKRQSQRLPQLAHWLKPPNVPADSYYDSDLLSTYRSESPATRQSWSGEWNTDMQDVIRALRLLR